MVCSCFIYCYFYYIIIIIIFVFLLVLQPVGIEASSVFSILLYYLLQIVFLSRFFTRKNKEKEKERNFNLRVLRLVLPIESVLQKLGTKRKMIET